MQRQNFINHGGNKIQKIDKENRMILRRILTISICVSFIIVLSSCEKVDFSNPRSVLEAYIKEIKEGRDYIAYDYLTEESKRKVSRFEFNSKYASNIYLCFKEYTIIEIECNEKLAKYEVNFSFRNVNDEEKTGKEIFTLLKEADDWRIHIIE